MQEIDPWCRKVEVENCSFTSAMDFVWKDGGGTKPGLRDCLAQSKNAWNVSKDKKPSTKSVSKAETSIFYVYFFA
jgi:hypothetical protein